VTKPLISKRGDSGIICRYTRPKQLPNNIKVLNQARATTFDIHKIKGVVLSII